MAGSKPLILVTGYSSGIGKAFVALQEVRKTFRFLFVGRQKPLNLRRQDFFVFWDFQIPELPTSIAEFDSKLDGIVFHHGVMIGKDFREISDAEMSHTLDVNLLASVKLMRVFSAQLLPGSAVIFYSSISASKGSFDDIYAMSKGGLESFSNSIALKMAPLGIRVVSLAPGLVDGTRMSGELKPGLYERTIERIPAGRPVSATAIARFAFDLLANKELTIGGGVISINGGQFLK